MVRLSAMYVYHARFKTPVKYNVSCTFVTGGTAYAPGAKSPVQIFMTRRTNKILFYLIYRIQNSDLSQPAFNFIFDGLKIYGHIINKRGL